MDAFYASVEQRDNPALQGQPVVVAWKGPRSVVCAASYEARRYGVHSAMSVARALRLCPHAQYVGPDFNKYREVSRHVREIFSRHTDLIEPLSLDEAYLDVTQNKGGLGSATDVARAIRAQIKAETALTASAGVAPNKFLAKIASDWNKPDGLFVLRPRDVLDFLTPLPVRKVPGVGAVMQGKLEQMGILTVGDLSNRSLAELEQRFGRYGRRLYELARGIDERPVEPDQLAQQVSAETTFEDDRPLSDLGEVIDKLALRVWEQALRKRGRGYTVTLKLKTDRFRLLTRSITSPVLPASAQALADMARQMRARVELPASTRYRLVGVGMSNFPDGETAARPRQADLFADLPGVPELPELPDLPDDEAPPFNQPAVP